MTAMASPTAVAVFSVFLLLVWRLWRFTVYPLIHTDEPRELPYWIPFVGHTIGFFKDQNDLLDRAGAYFNASREIYSITVAGQAIYVVSSPKDVAQAYKDTTAISWDIMVQDLYRTVVNMSDHSMKIMFAAQPGKKAMAKDKTQDDINKKITALHHQQLFPGKEFDQLLEKVLQGVNNYLNDCGTRRFRSTTRSLDDRSIVISLHELCEEAIATVMLEAYFGAAIWTVHPTILKDYDVWEKCNWKLLFQMPKLISKDAMQARDSLISAFESYYSLPKVQRSDCGYFFDALEQITMEAGMSRRDLSAITFLNTWAILANVSKVTFWLVSNLLFDQQTRLDLRDEVKRAVDEKGELDHGYLITQCPLLNSTHHETLRQVVSTSMARDVLHTTTLGGKVLKQGHRLLIPLLQLHRNRTAWGSEPSKWQPLRFVDSPRLLSSQALRPFGGGTTLCPGRNFSRQVVFCFVATLLTSFDTIELDNTTNKFPRMDLTKPTPGAPGVVDGDDVILRMKKRS